MENGLDLLAIPGDQIGTKEKMSRSLPYLARQLSVSRPRGPGSQLVNVACFLVPDDDARGNIVTHDLSWFWLRGRTSSKGGVRVHCIILHPECL